MTKWIHCSLWQTRRSCSIIVAITESKVAKHFYTSGNDKLASLWQTPHPSTFPGLLRMNESKLAVLTHLYFVCKQLLL